MKFFKRFKKENKDDISIEEEIKNKLCFYVINHKNEIDIISELFPKCFIIKINNNIFQFYSYSKKELENYRWYVVKYESLEEFELDNKKNPLARKESIIIIDNKKILTELFNEILNKKKEQCLKSLNLFEKYKPEVELAVG